MENRIKHLVPQEPAERQLLPIDYYEINMVSGTFAVSHAVARSIERRLALEVTPVWIVFRDLAGSRHRVRTETIRRLTESTRDQRRLDREFARERGKEAKEDRLPGDDDLDL